MRNLKRALSLALASVMLLGMMVVGAGAASYPDVDDNDNVEAIEVLNAVNVMIGEQGNFNPDSPVNRHQMAVIMAKLYLGPDTADSYVGSHPFTDVVPWADKYVAACYENGLVAGTSATTFGGGNPLTAVQAAAMMLRALGYKDLSKGADNWSVPVTAKANEIRLFNGVASNPKETLTRNQVAQLALNTLKSPMVTTIDGTFDVTSGEGGVIISGGAREYKVVARSDAYATAISSVEAKGNGAEGIEGYTVELGEHLYNGKLQLNNVIDDFGRPARKWEYNGKLIGSYVKEELLRQIWTEKVTGKMLADLLTKTTVDTYDFTIRVDGEYAESVLNATNFKADGTYGYYFNENYLNSGYKTAVGGTGNGVQTEVYVDAGNKQVYIAVINTYLAKAVGNYDEKKEEVSFKVHGLRELPGSSAVDRDMVRDTATDATLTVSADDFDIKDVKKDDIVLVNVADGAISVISTPEVMSSVTLTAFSTNDYVISDGNTIKYNKAARYDADVLSDFTGTQGVTNLRDKHYNLYLDRNGFITGVELVENYDNYIFLTGIDTANNDLKNTKAQAFGILTDGTTVEFTVNLEKSLRITNVDGDKYRGAFDGGAMWNTWCTYSVDSKGVYTLYEVGMNGGTKKAGQLHNAQDAGSTDTIDTKHYTMKADGGYNYLWNGKAVGKGYENAPVATIYGTENSVYMTAKLKTIAAKADMEGIPVPGGTGATMDYEASGNKVTIISGVDARSVDVKKTNMTVWTVANILGKSETTGVGAAKAPNGAHKLIPSGVYALYKDNGAVIAAIVIGEDNGVDKHWVVPKNGKIKQERFEASDAKAATEGDWIWSREVYDLTENIETVIEEKGDSPDAISVDKMKEGTAYEIRTDANGLVTSAKSAEDSLGAYTGGASDKNGYVTDISKLEEAIAATDKDVIIFADDTNEKYKFDGKTLWVDNASSQGMLVDPDVTVFFYQQNGGEWTTTVRTGASDLGSFLEQLNKGKDGISYGITALIKGSRAVSIVLTDNVKSDGQITGGGSSDKPSTSNPNVVAQGEYNTTSKEFEFTVTTTGSAVTVDEVVEAIKAFLATTGEKAEVTYNNAKKSGTITWDDKTTDKFTVVVSSKATPGEVASIDTAVKFAAGMGGDAEVDGDKVIVPAEGDKVLEERTQNIAANAYDQTPGNTIPEANGNEWTKAINPDTKLKDGYIDGAVKARAAGSNRTWLSEHLYDKAQSNKVPVTEKDNNGKDVVVSYEANVEFKVSYETKNEAGETVKVEFTVNIAYTVNAKEATETADGKVTAAYADAVAKKPIGTCEMKKTEDGYTVTLTDPEVTDKENGKYAGVAYITNKKDAQGNKTDSAASTKDTVAFLVALHEQGAEKITYDGKDYKWDESQKTASKWVNGSTTFVKAMGDVVEAKAKEEFAKNPDAELSQAFNVGLTFKGVEEPVAMSLVLNVIHQEDVNAKAEAKLTSGKTVAYGTLAEMLENAKATDVIDLQKDVAVTDKTLGITKDLTLNLNGHNIKSDVAGLTVIKIGDGTTPVDVTINGTGSITGSMTKDDQKNQPKAIDIEHGGELTIENVALSAYNAIRVGNETKTTCEGHTLSARLEMTNCTVTTEGNVCILTNGADNIKHTIVLNNCTLKNTKDKSEAMYLPGPSDVTINGGSVTASLAAIGIKSGRLTIKDATIESTGTDVSDKQSAAGKINTNSAAIFVDSNSNYEGGMVINITNSELKTAAAGPAIKEINAQNPTQITSLKMTGCTLTTAAGAKEGISLVELGEDSTVTRTVSVTTSTWNEKNLEADGRVSTGSAGTTDPGTGD